MTQDTHAVIYTDGGCKPSRGIGGWGIHGYIFTSEAPKQGSGCPTQIPTATGYVAKKVTEGDEDTGAKVARAVGAGPTPVTVLHYIDGLGSLIPESTNNEAELVALRNALQTAKDHGVKTIRLIPDSEYTLNCFNSWIHGWSKNGWLKQDGQPTANRGVCEDILALKLSLLASGVKFTTTWVRGHGDGLGDSFGNLIADSYASRGIIAGRKGESVHDINVVEGKGYWSQRTEINRMISQSKWYFNTNVESAPITEDGRYVYHLGEHGKEDDFLGKAISDSMMSIVYLRRPEPVLETLRAYQDAQDSGTHQSLVIGRLENITKADVYDTILENKGLYLQRAENRLDLFTERQLQLTKELRPGRLSFNAFTTLTVLETILNNYLTDPVKHRLTITDLTDLLYEVTEVKKGKSVCKLKPTFSSSTRAYPVQVGYDTGGSQGTCELTLTVGLDLPDRNTLAALAHLVPKVSLVTWREADTAFRYATVVEAGEDIGIWAGVYSNLHMLIPK